MVIGVISDTHDRIAAIERALEIFEQQQAELIVHCGDWTKPETLAFLASRTHELGLPLKGVLGNRDDQPALQRVNMSLPHPVELPDSLELLYFTARDKKIVVYHGHHKPTLGRLAKDPEIDVLLTGHTHKPRIDQLQDKLLINPGSTAFSIPRRREPRSVAMYDTTENRAELLYFDPS